MSPLRDACSLTADCILVSGHDDGCRVVVANDAPLKKFVLISAAELARRDAVVAALVGALEAPDPLAAEVQRLRAVQAALVAALLEFSSGRAPGKCPPDHCRFERAAVALALARGEGK